nr:MAG: capsid protein [Cressdnaviricota sp.]
MLSQRHHFPHLNVANLHRAYQYGRRGASMVSKLYRGFKRQRELAQQEPSRKKKMAPVKRQHVDDENGATDVRAYSTGNASHKKGVASRRKKGVKVSPAFKAKVIAATNSKMVSGYKEDVYYQATFGSALNQQTVGFNTALGVTAAPSLWSFLPNYFLDAVSCLFHDKFVANNWSYSSGPGIAGDMGNLGNNDNLKFYVQDSYEVYHWKNNTNRGLKLKLYECAPKRVSMSTATPPTGGGEMDALLTPTAYWSNAMGTDTNSLFNLQAVTPAFLGLAPSQSPTFVQGYKTGMTEVFLEPGSTYTYKLQGPSNLDVDFMKYYVNGTLQDIQKYCRFVMPVVSSELCVDTGTGSSTIFGRMPWAQNAATGNVLGCERKLYCKIKMPEQTGFVLGANGTVATGGTQDLNLRKNCFIATNWGKGTPVGPFSTMERQTELATLS